METISEYLPIGTFIVLLLGGILAWRKFGYEQKQSLSTTVKNLVESFNTLQSEFDRYKKEAQGQKEELELQITYLRNENKKLVIENGKLKKRVKDLEELTNGKA